MRGVQYHDSRFLATDNIRTSDSIRSPVDPRYLLDSVTQGFHLSCGRSSSRILYSGENSEGKKRKGWGEGAGEVRRANNRIRLLFWKKEKGLSLVFLRGSPRVQAACLKNV